MGEAARRKRAAQAAGVPLAPRTLKVPSFYLPADVGMALKGAHNQAVAAAARDGMPPPTLGQVLVAILRHALIPPAPPLVEPAQRLIVTPGEAAAQRVPVQ